MAYDFGTYISSQIVHKMVFSVIHVPIAQIIDSILEIPSTVSSDGFFST